MSANAYAASLGDPTLYRENVSEVAEAQEIVSYLTFEGVWFLVIPIPHFIQIAVKAEASGILKRARRSA